MNGLFNDKIINGILYDPNGNIIYKGDFINDKPKEGKNLKLYEHNGEIKDEGDFLDGDYSYGTLYGYNYYFKRRSKLYEGQFKKEEYHVFGKLYKDNYFGIYLYYDGYFDNGAFNGKGTLFYQNGQKFYEGIFMDNQIKGKGIKYYQNGSKKIEGIFHSLNFCEGIYYAPDNKELYKGKIKNEIPINSNDVVLYNDNTFKIYEGEMINGTYEGYGIEYYPLVKDMVMYKGYFSNNNFILHKTDDTTYNIKN